MQGVALVSSGSLKEVKHPKGKVVSEVSGVRVSSV